MLDQRRVDYNYRSIPSREMGFHPHSFADSAGRLFAWKGELYRGIKAESARFFSELLNNGVIQSLIEAGLLVETEQSNLSADGFEMVVHHKRVPFVSYPNEWCADMLKDAALLMLDLEIELTKRGLELKDGHPWNILFDGCKPVYVDLTSIQPARDKAVWSAYDEYCRFCYYPLILMCYGQERIARCLVSEYDGVRREDLSILTRRLAFSPFLLAKILRRASRQITRSTGRLSFLTRLKEDLQKMRPPHNHHKQSDLLTQQGGIANERALYEVLDELRPQSVLDVSGAEGSYSIQAARRAGKVVSFETDPARVTRLYREARKESLPILPLVMSFVKPTPSAGYSGHYAMAATERFKCDLVLAFSLVDELVFERYFNFELIAEGLSSFSNRWLLVEFISREDKRVSAKWGDRFAWYTLDNFISNLRDWFHRVTILPDGAKDRALLLCEK